ncbi:hypothetical protein niasHT_029159 [Heterodera trifolii]|uniref:BEACH domain-containing protein n=1 Tax=Heterodera trifolii TaxID=157864 RepID=A0ABD2JYE3_9BILA
MLQDENTSNFSRDSRPANPAYYGHQLAANIENHQNCLQVLLQRMDSCGWSLVVSGAEHSVADELRKDFSRGAEQCLQVPLSEQYFPPKQWAHLAIVVSRPSLLLKSSNVYNCEVFVNGHSLASQKLQLWWHSADSGGQQPGLNAYIGTLPFFRRGSIRLRWRLASLCLVEEALGANVLRKMVALGVAYTGNYQTDAFPSPAASSRSALIPEENVLLSLTLPTALSLRSMFPCRTDAEMIAALVGISPNDQSTSLRILWNITSCPTPRRALPLGAGADFGPPGWALRFGRLNVPFRARRFLECGQKNIADVKELIPEFFFLPQMFLNENAFDLGIKQNGTRLDGVPLPAWSHGDAHEFVRLHRQALECDFVSEHLHEWVDLIFGYKQTGDASRKPNNDPLTRNATLGFINNFGQIPAQLFKKPHPQRKIFGASPLGIPPPVSSFLGLTVPRLFYHCPEALRVSARPVKELRTAVGEIVVGERGNQPSSCVFETNDVYEITCMVTTDGRQVFAGLSTGTVFVWFLSLSPAPSSVSASLSVSKSLLSARLLPKRATPSA